jgi:hypothetical protein
MIAPTARTSFTRSKLGVVIMGGVAALLLSSQLVHAAEPGESSGEFGGATDSEKPKQPYSLQASDPDAPQDPAVVAAKKRAAAEAELAKKKPVDTGPPVYQKWQFWAIAGGVLVGVLGAIYATSKIVHSANGGDVAPCPMDYRLGCQGEGR